MNRTIKRGLPAALAITIVGGVALTPVTAQASEEGRRNTALGLGAATAYLFTKKGDKVPAFAGLAATGYAYKKYNDAIKDRHRKDAASRESRYRSGDDRRFRRGDHGEDRNDNGHHKGRHKGRHKSRDNHHDD